MASDKTIILITGANSGIGFETVIALAEKSADYHILLGSRSIEKGKKALDEIQTTHGSSLKGTISLLNIDVSSKASIEAAAAEVSSSHGKLDVLINNAGVLLIPPMESVTLLRTTFETNVYGPYITTETFEPLLKKSPSPRIIYVSSGQGSIATKLDASHPHSQLRADHYRMSKAALNMLAAGHKVHNAEWGCKVACFDPGFTVSNLTGPEGRKMRIKMGARDAKDPANALVNIVTGEWADVYEKPNMVDLDHKVVPW